MRFRCRSDAPGTLQRSNIDSGPSKLICRNVNDQIVVEIQKRVPLAAVTSIHHCSGTQRYLQIAAGEAAIEPWKHLSSHAHKTAGIFNRVVVVIYASQQQRRNLAALESVSRGHDFRFQLFYVDHVLCAAGPPAHSLTSAAEPRPFSDNCSDAFSRKRRDVPIAASRGGVEKLLILPVSCGFLRKAGA